MQENVHLFSETIRRSNFVDSKVKIYIRDILVKQTDVYILKKKLVRFVTKILILWTSIILQTQMWKKTNFGMQENVCFS